MRKSALHITLSRLGGLLVFLVLLTVANVLYFNSSIYLEIVSFLNTKILVIILFSLLLYLGELFFVFGFPLNFPAPIFNAFGGIFLVDFIFSMMIKGLEFADVNLSLVMRTFEIIVVIIVFILAIIVGYIRVFSSVGAKSRRKKEAKKKEKEEWDWDDVKKEIKDTVHDVVGNIKNAVDPEEEKPKSKKKVSKKKTSKKKSSKKK